MGDNEAHVTHTQTTIASTATGVPTVVSETKALAPTASGSGEARASSPLIQNPAAAADDGSLVNQADVRLATGQKAMALKKYGDAVEHFSQACELLANKYGETQPECGEALLLYGKALLENAIQQSHVLGQSQVQQNTTGNNEASASTSGGPSAGSSSTSKLNPAPKSAPGPSSRIHFSGDSSDEEDEDENAQTEDAPPPYDLDDELENAFNALDMARVAFVKAEATANDEAGKVAARKRQATVFDLIGDVHAESEQFPLAVESYRSSLELKKAFEPNPEASRLLAETHFMLALAYEYVTEPSAISQAITHASAAQSIMHSRLSALEAKVNASTSTPRDLEEIKDIVSLIGELDAKVEDLRTVPEMSKEEINVLEREKQMEEFLKDRASIVQGLGTGPSGLGEGAVVNDLSLLVKKKKAGGAASQPASAEGLNSQANGVRVSGKRKAKVVDDHNATGEGKKPKVA